MYEVHLARALPARLLRRMLGFFLITGLFLPAVTASEPSLAGHEEADSFTFYLNEEVLVRTDYTWDAGGAYEATYTLSMAGQTVTTTLSIEAAEDGSWRAMAMETAQGPVTITRQDSTAEVTHDGKSRVLPAGPEAILFENFNPALIRLFVDGYDQAAGGKQEFSIFIVPQIVMTAALERLDEVERTITGRDWHLTRYRFGLPGVDVTLYIDDEGRLVFGDVPAQHGAYVRSGFESLLAPEEVDPALSAPEYDVLLDADVAVPMRDGLGLMTDIYRPDAPGQFPVILVRTPYKKELNDLQARFYARRGYIFAVQDCRGRFSSPGDWVPFFNEAKDGYDTIEWLAERSWSTGRVGMIGASYLGWVQWWAASERPPHLTTIIPNVSPPDPFFNIPYEYGTFFLLGAIWWADVLESEATGDISGVRMREVNDKDYQRLLRHLPVIEIDELVLGKKNEYWRSWIDHPVNDEFWAPANFLNRLGPLDIPVFHQSGWFDGDGIGSKLNYQRMRSFGHRNQKLTLGPWGHTDTATRRIGDQDFGPNAIIDLQREYLRWLDRWLKGVDNGIEREPLVSVFVMETNRWLQGNAYPLPETEFTRFYLRSDGAANGLDGDGWLSNEPPGLEAPPDHFVYDPGDPTPTPKMGLQEDEDDTGDDGDGEAAPDTLDLDKITAERYAQYENLLTTRDDILVYTTPPLEEPLTIAGPISAVIWAASSAPDTDWFARLSIVTEEETIHNLVEGKIRARFRNSMRAPELLTPGRVYRYELDLWQTGITIHPGQKLLVEIASASFPLFSRNLNTGEHNEKTKRFRKAEQTIYHDRARPSYVLLPVIPGFEPKDEASAVTD